MMALSLCRGLKMIIVSILDRLFEVATVLVIAALHGSLLIQFVELEGVSVLLAHILTGCKAVQVKDQVQHLFVALLMIKRYNGDAIIDLVSERVHRVVYNYHVFHHAIGNDAQILDVVALWRLYAVLAVHTVLE